MDLQSIKVSACYESETNPRGTKFDGATFKELVASVKEKGILVPVLVRQRKHGAAEYEVIAGSRRLRAAKEAGLKEIPAQVVEMNDTEAREAQIVENLQREDIHPLEEGEAYRQLIEQGQLAVKDVAIKVGKSETYVRDRLFLTNLSAKARKSYRAGNIVASVAALIAKLSETDQAKALEYAEGDNWEHPTTSDVKEWIHREFYTALDNQPWLRDKEAVKSLPAHLKNCHPNDAALFGDLKEGQCTDSYCWIKRMAAWTKYRCDKTPSMVIVSDAYGDAHSADTLGRNSYVAIKGKKDRCKFAVPAIIGEGHEVGKEIAVCVTKECTKHYSERSEYARTPKEEADRKAAQKKERQKEAARQTKFDLAICDAIFKVSYPLSEKHLDVLLDLVFERCGTAHQMPLVKRHGLKADVKKSKDYTSRDYEAPLRRMAEDAGNNGKLRMIFELLSPTFYVHGDDKDALKVTSKF
jgi:ParB family transcriptional regulator, chromosome partitioning protein